MKIRPVTAEVFPQGRTQPDRRDGDTSRSSPFCERP